MNVTRLCRALKRHAERLGSDTSGATLVEFAVVIALFLFIFFGTVDFGRMAFHYVTSEKAMHIAARVAAVRPPACSGVPQTNKRGTLNGSSAPDFGTRCNSTTGVCAALGKISCSGDISNSTVAEIWPLVQSTLPNSAVPSNLLFSYEYDDNLGFLGGPYVPVVTVELQNLNFQFVAPLASLVALVTGVAPAGLGGTIPYPSMSVSLPGEDLAHGTAG